jgi:cell surface protein SprA
MEANQYRKYTGDLNQRGLQEVPEPYDANFTVSTVNVEENSSTGGSAVGDDKYIYSVPPGYVRDRDYTQVTTVRTERAVDAHERNEPARWRLTWSVP